MYLAILIGLFLLRYGAARRADNYGHLYWFVLIGLFFFSAFRFRVGCDWSGYYNNYLAGWGQDYSNVLTEREPVWWLLQITLNRWGWPYPIVNVLTSFIFFIGIDALARRQPDRLGFLVLMFPILIINMPMSGIRQAAGIGFLCLSIVAFLDRKPIYYAGWLLVGGTIHSSVLAFLLFAPLTMGLSARIRSLLMLLMAPPGLYLLGQSDSATVALGRYVDTGIDAFGAIFRVSMLALTGMFFLTALISSWKRDYPRDVGVASLGAWIMLALLPVVAISTVIGDRLGYYLIPIQSMIFARIPYLALKSNRQLFSALPYLGLVIVFSYWTLNSSIFDQCYNPYQSWLFGNSDLEKFGH